MLLLFWVVRVCLPFSRRQRMKQALPLGKSHKSTDHMCRWPQWSSASHQTHEWPYPGGTQETQYRKPSPGAQRGPWPWRMAWWQPHCIHTFKWREAAWRMALLWRAGESRRKSTIFWEVQRGSAFRAHPCDSLQTASFCEQWSRPTRRLQFPPFRTTVQDEW